MQSPGNSQNFNRYSYCLNNPLKFTDPSGYTFERIKKYYDDGTVNENPNIGPILGGGFDFYFGGGSGGGSFGNGGSYNYNGSGSRNYSNFMIGPSGSTLFGDNNSFFDNVLNYTVVNEFGDVIFSDDSNGDLGVYLASGSNWDYESGKGLTLIGMALGENLFSVGDNIYGNKSNSWNAGATVSLSGVTVRSNGEVLTGSDEDWDNYWDRRHAYDAAREQAQINNIHSAMYAAQNAVAKPMAGLIITAVTVGIIGPAVMADEAIATYGSIANGIKNTYSASIDGAVKLYLATGNVVDAIAAIPAAVEGIQIVTGVGIGVYNNWLPPTAPGITTGVPLIDYFSSSTEGILKINKIVK